MKFETRASLLIVVGIVAISCTCLNTMSAQSAVTARCNTRSAFSDADQLLKQRHYEEAQATLAMLLKCQNLSAIDTFRVGWFYGRAHNFNKALEVLQSVDPAVPDPQTHQYAIGLSQFELGDYKSAVETLKDCDRPDASNLRGVALSKLGRYQEAHDVFEELLRDNPSDLLAYFNLITLYADTGQFNEAADTADEAVRRFPRNADVRTARGAAYMLTGRIAKAHGDFAAAIALAPSKPSPHFLFALSDFKQGHYEAAASTLRSALRSGIKDSDLHYLLAETLLKVKSSKLQDSIDQLDKAIELNPRSVSALALRGKLRLEEGKATSAVVDLKLAHEIDPTSQSATYNLARAYRSLGMTEEAKRAFGELAVQTPDGVSDMATSKLKAALSPDATE